MKASKKQLLLILIAISALPQLCEQAYAIVLPDIAEKFAILEGRSGLTITVFLFGFALGMFFWGNRADTLGRRPSVLFGMSIYLFGSLLCLLSSTFNQFLISRFIQAFGGSTSSIIVQTIARDSFQNHERGKAFSLVIFTHALFPALAFPIAGYFCERFGWPFVFIEILILGIPILAIAYMKLPETLNIEEKILTKSSNPWLSFFLNKKTFCLAAIVGVSNGVLYSYYSKSSFYFSKFLNLHPSQYGYFGLLVALGSMSGAASSFILNRRKIKQSFIIFIGCGLILIGSIFFALSKFMKNDFYFLFISFGLVLIMLGFNMTIPNCLSLALEDFTHSLGKIGALLGLFYYSLIGLITFVSSYIDQKNGLEFPLLLISLASLNLLFCCFAFASRSAKSSSFD